MKKKFLALALALVMCLSLLPVSALAADGDFKIVDKTLVQYKGKGGDVVIPSGITRIAERAFYGLESVTSVTVPEGVKSIGGFAFANCGMMKSITLPESLEAIEIDAFVYCENLVDITLPKGLKELGNVAFRFCTSLTSIDIPEGVQEIGSSTFWGCSKLKNVTLHEGLEGIGGNAFVDCSSLEEINIPSSVQYISGGAFDGSGLTSITLPEGIENLGYSVFGGCAGLKSIDIPDSVQHIGLETFKGCTGLESVKLPKALKDIREYAFLNCENLTSVVIPDGTESIGFNAFANCDKLTDITIPPSVKFIGTEAFGMDYNYDRYEPYEYGYVTIHGQAGSTAEKYASKNNIKFEADWTAPVDPVEKFEDVNAGDWFVESIKYVLDKNLFVGTSDTTFSPNATMTRAMFCVVLARTENASQTVEGADWYKHDVQWAIDNGYYDGRDPEGAIPRQEMALMLYRRAGSPAVSGSLDSFVDADTVSDEAKDAMIWAVDNGYIKGMGQNNLYPYGSASRAEVATIFMRVFG